MKSIQIANSISIRLESQIYATASEHIIDKLDPVHNQAIRLCTESFWSSPVLSFCAGAGDAQLKYRRERYDSNITLGCRE